MIKLIIFLILLSVSNPAFSVQEKCDGTAGITASKKGDHRLAFKLLKKCENNPNVSGRALGILATYYVVFNHNRLNKTELANKFYELNRRAALKGEQDAIMNLAGEYDVGDDLLKIKPNEEIADCLREIADNMDKYSKDKVIKCLNKNKTNK